MPECGKGGFGSLWGEGLGAGWGDGGEAFLFENSTNMYVLDQLSFL